MSEGLDAAIAVLSMFGGVSLIIWTSVQAKIARIKAEADAHRTVAAPMPTDTVLAELKAMRQQMEQMQSTSHQPPATSHQFDISFDAALSRLEERVSRVETKVAASPSSTSQSEQYQRTGQG